MEEQAKETPDQPALGKAKPTIVGIGASAGGLAALKRFFAKVPEQTGLSFVVVMHLSPEHESHLANLLQPFCRLPVQQVTETVALEPDCIYVIPPGRNLSTVDTHLRLTQLEERRRERAPVDHFFRTLANTHNGDSVGVILTGTGSDGTLGIKDIKGSGGLTVVQDPNEAEFDGMPQSAISTRLVDLVLPLDQMAGEILRYVHTHPRIVVPTEGEALDEAQRQTLSHIFTQVRACTGRDFSRYKRSTVMRRIQRRMQLLHIEELSQYADLLSEKPDETRALADEFLITVTNFFRDREVFDTLEKEVIPALFEGKGPDQQVRVWSVGCATGEEAYSLAMLLLEEAARRDNPPGLQVFASDMHEASLKTGREGLYSGDIEIDVPPERVDRFFIKENGGFRIRKEVREVVIFAPHNLLGDPPFSKLDMVACRNVMIYLQRDVQQEVIEVFHYALNPDGYLLLGASETSDRSELFQMENKQYCLYRKRNVPTHNLHLPVFPLSHARPTLPGQGEKSEPVERHLLSYGALHQQMVERYAPPSILVNPEHTVVHFSEHAGRYLVHPGGNPTSNVFKLIREELRLELRAALVGTGKEGHAVRTRPIALRLEGEIRHVVIHVRPPEERRDQGLTLIIFEELTQGEAAQKPLASGLDAGGARPQTLEAELDINKQRLQAVIEEYETSQEEMKAANEELQSANEELRSAMEELETSKEELQSMNEELAMVNQENRHKVEELSQLSSDLQNLLSATDIATIFLDREFRILRFTPQLGTLYNIRTADRGRPLSDLTHRLGYDRLIDDARQVLEKLIPIDREVRDVEDRWYLTRVRPYRSRDDHIGGVVITFVDITERKTAEQSLREINETLEARVEERTLQVRQLASKLTMAEQKERRRVSQILHDNLQQLLYGLQMKTRMLEEQLEAAGQRELTASIAETRSWLQEAIETTRQLTVDLSPPILKDEGLADAIEWLKRQMQQLHGLEIELKNLNSPYTSSENLRALLFQVVRELLFNIKKHSGVDRAILELDQIDERILIKVSDSGQGFDPTEMEDGHGSGFGLVSVRERLRLLGGDMEIDSAPGQGTTILIWVPATPSW